MESRLARHYGSLYLIGDRRTYERRTGNENETLSHIVEIYARQEWRGTVVERLLMSDETGAIHLYDEVVTDYTDL